VNFCKSFPLSISPFFMSRRHRRDNKDDKFDKDKNTKLFQSLKLGDFVKFEGVDASVVEEASKIDKNKPSGEVEHDYRIKIKALAPSISLHSEYLDASLHEIKLLEEGPNYQVNSFFSISIYLLLPFLLYVFSHFRLRLHMYRTPQYT